MCAKNMYLLKSRNKFEKKNESIVFNFPIELYFQNKLDKQPLKFQ